MDINQATSTLMMRIQQLDPENASKVMGYVLIQDPGEKEMIRLALGPDTILINLINKAKTQLGISSNTSSAPSSPSVFNPPRRSLLAQTSPRVIPPTPWCAFPPKSHVSSPSYASAVVNGASGFDPTDEFTPEVLFDTKGLNFMDSAMSPSARSDSIVFPFDNFNETHHHRRSFSVSDAYQSDDNNNDGGWRPCMFFAKGFCKNGSDCKFVHDLPPDSAFVGSPKMDRLDELFRYKALQQQRFATASQLLAEEGASFPYNRCINFLNENQRSALMMGEEYHKFGRCRPDMNAFGFGGIPNSSARQIYLTFPADSTFKEEDVSRYFGTYGPVQDVRIPYQQKRMFGFVTFVYPETVKQILAHGNPHFVCDSRVLVKPYKEKGKLPDKYGKQHMDRGEFPECLSPSGLDLTEPFDHPFGGRVIYNSHEMMLRRKIQEQADIEQAIECHGRRLMNLQLLDLPSHHPNHQLRSHIVPAGSPQNRGCINPNLMFLSDDLSQEYVEGSNGGNGEDDSPTTGSGPKILQEVNESGIVSNGVDSDKEENPNLENYGHHGSLEDILPQSLFTSPTKSSSASAELDSSIPLTSSPISSNDVQVLPGTSKLIPASLKPCFVDMPREV